MLLNELTVELLGMQESARRRKEAHRKGVIDNVATGRLTAPNEIFAAIEQVGLSPQELQVGVDEHKYRLLEKECRASADYQSWPQTVLLAEQDQSSETKTEKQEA